MSAAYDTLGFAKHLTAAGVPQEHADALTEAIRDKVMTQLATNADIAQLKHLIERESLRTRMWLGATIIGASVTAVGFISAIVKLG